MRKPSWLILSCTLASALLLASYEFSAPPEIEAVASPAAATESFQQAIEEAEREAHIPPSSKPCLECHGPFEKMMSAEPIYEITRAGRINPHRYVPHYNRDIPDCLNCHDEHPVPPTSEEELSKANVEWCYIACHHLRDFTPCRECHN